MASYPNETPEYRKARDELVDAEEELRAQVERVAALRRRLPLGGEIDEDYVFEERDPAGGVHDVRLSELFEPGHDSLLIYGYMYSSDMERPCPMCTSFLDALNAQAPHVRQRMSVVVAARSPIERVLAFTESRGWDELRIVSTANNDFPLRYHTEAADGSQLPMPNVFVRRNGRIHHSWGAELFFRPFETGNTRHVDMLWPLWNLLDLSPEGRGDWYPALECPS